LHATVAAIEQLSQLFKVSHSEFNAIVLRNGARVRARMCRCYTECMRCARLTTSMVEEKKLLFGGHNTSTVSGQHGLGTGAHSPLHVAAMAEDEVGACRYEHQSSTRLMYVSCTCLWSHQTGSLFFKYVSILPTTVMGSHSPVPSIRRSFC
jgi:hypothetical protein